MYAQVYYVCIYDRLYSVFAYKFPKSSISTDSNVAPASVPINNIATTATAATASTTTVIAATTTFTNGMDCNNDKDRGDITSMKENITPTNDSENATGVAVTPPLIRHRKVVVFSQVLT